MDISKERSILRVASCPGDSRRPMGFVSIRDQAGFFGACAVPLRVLTIGRAGATVAMATRPGSSRAYRQSDCASVADER